MIRREYHSIAWMRRTQNDDTLQPALIIDTGSDARVFIDAWGYLQHRSVKELSMSWTEKLISDLGRCYDYFFRNSKSETLSISKSANIISRFIDHLIEQKTPLPDINIGQPSRTELSRIERNLQRFSIYLSTHEVQSTSFSQALSRAGSNTMEQSKNRITNKQRNWTIGQADDKFADDPYRSFPAELIKELIYKGCRLSRKQNRPGKWSSQYDINLVMALCILAGTGRRKSELFHLWLEDVQTEVFLYHPSLGVAERHGRKIVTRRDILREKFNLMPRNLVRGGQRAGWKSVSMLDPKHMRSTLQWISTELRDTFYSAFYEYRDHVIQKSPTHPYLFTTLSPNTYGSPWTISAFDGAFQRALSRIGMQRSQIDGICPHGLRHFVGNRAVELDLPPFAIQDILLHKSVESQTPYTRPRADKVKKLIDEKLRSGDL